MKTFDIELFQHKNDRRGYVAIYLVEDVTVPTRELEYHSENDNCVWVRDTTFTTPHLGYGDTVEKIIRIQTDGVVVNTPVSYAPWLDERTKNHLAAVLHKLAK